MTEPAVDAAHRGNQLRPPPAPYAPRHSTGPSGPSGPGPPRGGVAPLCHMTEAKPLRGGALRTLALRPSPFRPAGPRGAPFSAGGRALHKPCVSREQLTCLDQQQFDALGRGKIKCNTVPLTPSALRSLVAIRRALRVHAQSRQTEKHCVVRRAQRDLKGISARLAFFHRLPPRSLYPIRAAEIKDCRLRPSPFRPAGPHGLCLSSRTRRGPAGGAAALRAPLGAGAEIVAAGDAASGAQPPGAATASHVTCTGGERQDREEGNDEWHGEQDRGDFIVLIHQVTDEEARHRWTGVRETHRGI